ncbi:MAG TPA: glycosyltransferase family 4 protein [Polyangia bacterium]
MSLRILHVIESMAMGGAERHLANLLQPLEQLGVENQLVTLWSGDAYMDHVRPYAAVHDCGLRPRRVAPAIPALIRFAREADVVHTQLPWADIAGRVAAIATRRPSVTTLQTTWYDRQNVATFEPNVQRRVRLVRRIDRITARSTRRFFAVSEATRRTYVQELGIAAERIQVIPNSVDLGQFNGALAESRVEARARFGMAPDEIATVMVARLVAPKGHAHAIEAVHLAAARLPVKLYIAGTGPEEQRLRALAAERNAPVVFLGACTEVPSLLSASDLFLFPSVIEGMPLALIEAMAMGRAALCSDIPENREAGGDTVAYSPVGDVAALTRAWSDLALDAARRAQLGAAAQVRARRFSSQTIAAELLRAIEEVLRQERARGHVVAR